MPQGVSQDLCCGYAMAVMPIAFHVMGEVLHTPHNFGVSHLGRALCSAQEYNSSATRSSSTCCTVLGSTNSSTPCNESHRVWKHPVEGWLEPNSPHYVSAVRLALACVLRSHHSKGYCGALTVAVAPSSAVHVRLH